MHARPRTRETGRYTPAPWAVQESETLRAMTLGYRASTALTSQPWAVWVSVIKTLF
jgi:hypothetical protein